MNYSLDYSKKKQVVIERYMDCDDVSFEYKIQEGEVSLASICDRYIYKTPYGGSVTSKLIYPSKYIDVYLDDVDKKVKRMFQCEGLKNGVLFMQAFVDNGNFYFYEMGYRLSGGRHFIFTKNQNGDSSVEELIYLLKNNVLSSKKFILLAEKIKLICAQFEVIFLLTNRCDVAFALDCDGIVLEQNEIDGHIARHILGNEKIIGSYDINDKYADFYIIENNDNELSYEKIYFKKINKDCLSDNAVFLHRAYRG